MTQLVEVLAPVGLDHPGDGFLDGGVRLLFARRLRQLSGAHEGKGFDHLVVFELGGDGGLELDGGGQVGDLQEPIDRLLEALAVRPQVLGGLKGLQARCTANADALEKIVAERDWLGNLAVDKGIRSKTSVCLTVEGADADFIKKFAGLLDKGKPLPGALRFFPARDYTTADGEVIEGLPCIAALMSGRDGKARALHRIIPLPA